MCIYSEHALQPPIKVCLLGFVHLQLQCDVFFRLADEGFLFVPLGLDRMQERDYVKKLISKAKLPLNLKGQNHGYLIAAQGTESSGVSLNPSII